MSFCQDSAGKKKRKKVKVSVSGNDVNRVYNLCT